MKNPKLIIGIVAIVVLLIIFYLVYKNSKRTITDKKGTTIQQAGIFDSFMAFFQPKPSGTSGGGGGGFSEAWCKLFPKSKGCKPAIDPSDCYNKTGSHPGCLSSKIGYNCDGEKDSFC